MTTPAIDIQDQVRAPIDSQIETFGQAEDLTPSQLREFHYRTDKAQQALPGTKSFGGHGISPDVRT